MSHQDKAGVALVGPMAAGKTTVANELIARYGFAHISMIGAFRDLFAEAYPGIGKGDELTVDRDHMCMWVDCPAHDEFGLNPHFHTRTVTVSGRQQMQDFAPATRAIDNMFWTRIAFTRAQRHIDAGTPLVSDDVRYPSEAEYARSKGMLIVRIETPRMVRLARYAAAYGRLPTEAEESAPTELMIPEIRADLQIDGRRDPATNAHELARTLLGDKSPRVQILKDSA